METNELTKILEKNGLKLGRMIANHKTEYLQKHPFNKVFFNACIFELDEGKEVWYGDIDLNDEKTLNALINSALEYNAPFLLTVETPYRFAEKLKIGNIINVDDIKFIKTKYGWIGGGFDLSKLSKDEIDELFNKMDIAVFTEEKVVKSSDTFDKVLFAPEDSLTEENEYGGIDYIKSAIKLLSKFF
jgi:hypothetical protein